jgi:hypothetical protein
MQVWILSAMAVFAIGGLLVVPCVMALLAMRSKLPWTGPKPVDRGFPVEMKPTEPSPIDP